MTMSPSSSSEVLHRIVPSRDGELTAVVHREMFDKLPGGVTDPADIERWRNFREAYHRASRLEEFTEFPLQLDFELNSTCQMKCGFCVHGNSKVEKRMMLFDDFKRVIDEGSQYGLCSIKMNYINEPLLNRELPKYIEYARSKGVLNVYFATNGILLNDQTIRELIRVKVSKVMISLDAVTPETFLLMRKSDKFDAIKENIRSLIAIRRELGVDYPIVRVNFLKTRINGHEAERFIEEWTGVADAIGFQDQVGLPGIENDFDDTHGEKLERFRCSFPFKLMVIDSAGNILPCCTFSGREMPMGSIHEMTIKEAWDSVQMRKLKTMHQGGDFSENSTCVHCVGGCGKAL